MARLGRKDSHGKPRSREVSGREGLKALVLIAVIVSAVYMATFSPQVIVSDGADDLRLGREILSGKYSFSFFDRMPLLPFTIALLFFFGFSVSQVSFMIPLASMLAALASTYVLAKKVSSERSAVLSCALLACFPMFVRWGSDLLVDIPLLVMANMLLYCAFVSLDDERYLAYCGLFSALGLLLKLSFAVPVACVFSYLAWKKGKAILSRNAVVAAAIFFMVFSSFFAVVYRMNGSLDTRVLKGIVEHVTDPKQSVVAQVASGASGGVLNSSASQLLQLLMFFPIVLLPTALYHAFRSGGRKAFLSSYVAVFFASIIIFWVVRLRYFSPLYSVMMLLIAEECFLIEKKIDGLKRSGAKIGGAAAGKKAFWAVFGLMCLGSLAGGVYLRTLDSDSLWGAGILSGKIKDLASSKGGSPVIASDYLPHYIYAATGLKVLDIPNHYALPDGTFISESLVTESFRDQSHPKHGEYSWIHMNRTLRTVKYFGDNWITQNGVDYVILSVYSEFDRKPTDETFHPKLGPIELSMISRPYSNGRVPEDYAFSSELYDRLEKEKDKYERVDEVFREGGEGQRIFLIYEVKK